MENTIIKKERVKAKEKVNHLKDGGHPNKIQKEVENKNNLVKVANRKNQNPLIWQGVICVKKLDIL